MKSSTGKLWSVDFLNLTTQSNDYWRAQFNVSILIVAMGVYTLMFFINAVYFESPIFAAIDGIGVTAASLILWHFRKYKNINLTSWATTILITSLILVFLVLAEGYSFSIFWVTVLPPIAFFLLGSKWGLRVIVACFVLCIYLVYQQVSNPKETVSTAASLINVTQVCFIHLILFSFYERARTSAYSQLQVQNLRVVELSEQDSLTGLANRSKFDDVMYRMLSNHARTNKTLCLVVVDIDHFKQVNDTYGHVEGDRILCGLADILASSVREADFAARWAGEEFAILFENTSLEKAQELAERLRIQIADTPISGKHITVSIGIGRYISGEIPTEFFNRVDKALYESKRNGRNQTSVSKA